MGVSFPFKTVVMRGLASCSACRRDQAGFVPEWSIIAISFGTEAGSVLMGVRVVMVSSQLAGEAVLSGAEPYATSALFEAK
jgi:hypothetical protein